MAQRIKHLPTVEETWVRSLGWEYPLDKEVATHSSILAWRIPWTEDPDGLLMGPWGRKELDMTERLQTHTYTHTNTHTLRKKILPGYTSSVVKDTKILLTVPNSGVLMDQRLALNCFQTILIVLSTEKMKLEEINKWQHNIYYFHGLKSSILLPYHFSKKITSKLNIFPVTPQRPKLEKFE